MITGIDLGLDTTSLYTIDEDGNEIARSSFGTKVTPSLKLAVRYPQSVRHMMYYNYFSDYFKSNNITGTVVMEDPKGNFMGNAIKIAEMKGYYCVFLAQHFEHSKIYLLPAVTIKKAFTGKGNASKDDIVSECEKRGYNPSHHHEADAISMALIAKDGYFI